MTTNKIIIEGIKKSRLAQKLFDNELEQELFVKISNIVDNIKYNKLTAHQVKVIANVAINSIIKQ